MTAVDRPDNGQGEGRRGFLPLLVPVEGHAVVCGTCGALVLDNRNAISAHRDSHLASGRAGAGEQQRDDDEDCGHHSWAGLMALLDEHWPADIFPTREDDITRDAGARIVSLLRWLALLGGPQPDGEAEYATARHVFGSPEHLAELDQLSAPPCPVYSHGDSGWHCAVTGDHDQHINAAGDVTW